MSEQDENKLIAERKSKLVDLRNDGNPFVNDFKPKELIQEIHASFGESTNESLEQNKKEVSVAGRIMLKRQSQLCSDSRFIRKNSAICVAR